MTIGVALAVLLFGLVAFVLSWAYDSEEGYFVGLLSIGISIGLLLGGWLL